MTNSKLDVDFAMAYEVILDDLKSGLKDDNQPEIPCTTALSFAASKHRLDVSEEDDVFLEVRPTESNLEAKDMWCCSPTTTSSDKQCLVSKSWSETTHYRESSCISVLPTLNHANGENTDIPNITHQMSTVDLLDHVPSYHHDFHVDFLNLKSVYFRNAMKTEDSLVYVFLKSMARIERVKVYLKEWRTSDVLCLGSSIELQSSFDKRRGLLTIDLNFPFPWISTEETKWQLTILAQFEDGRTMTCCSNTFLVRSQISKNRLQEIPLSHYQLHGRQLVIDCSKTNCTTCPQRKVSTRRGGGENDVTIKLLPGTKLNYQHILCEVRKDEDIVYIEEQANLPGLLKQEKGRPCRDKNCFKKTPEPRTTTPETLSWVCGHCFFKRIKKSTVKSHVKQRVCLKRRRASAESLIKQQQRKRRGIPRRSYTYPGIFF